ncbi:EAL domain-containing protein [Burkholderia sp. BCC0398]|uniref:EAL domain-containing protein n=1 Tax=Burkholderia sp. BCC0398 TaxID=2676297 RepID=UPI00158E7ADD|nr:EAL domain-containing protein [Burkholderia sp. BCC0398]
MKSKLLVEVANSFALERCFGHMFGDAVDVDLAERTRQFFGVCGRVQAICGGNLLNSELVTRGARGCGLARDLARRAECELGEQGFAPSVAIRLMRPGVDAPTRTDFAIAGHVLRAIATDACTLVMSPVYSVDDGCDVLYFECSPWCRALGGRMSPPHAYLPSSTRVGLMCHLDRYVLRRVLDLLKRSPELRIGVNLTGQSLVVGLHWEDLFDQLSASPDLAARLVVVIAESAEIEVECAGCARVFLARLKAAGCLIAIDQYGLTYGNAAGMEIPDPDIVKIAPTFISAARRNDRALGRLRRLVELAANIARDVVVIGAEGDVDLQLVRDVGVRWVQC